MLMARMMRRNVRWSALDGYGADRVRQTG